jgi:hypothetical protein
MFSPHRLYPSERLNCISFGRLPVKKPRKRSVFWVETFFLRPVYQLTGHGLMLKKYFLSDINKALKS